MVIFIVLLIVFSVLSFIISMWTLVYLRKAVKKEHEHVQKLFRINWKLKDHLQKQMGQSETKFEKHVKAQAEWENSLRQWFAGEVLKQHTAIELGVGKVAAAVDTIAKSRESTAKSFLTFVATFRAELREEKKALRGDATTTLPTESIDHSGSEDQ